MAFLGAVVASDWHGLLRRGPARSRAHARSRIERVLARPWVLDGAYSDLRTVAYMDLWKGVVQVFVEASDAVVFDLRGYNDERGGSPWEVGYLFDTLPVQRIVFVRHASDAAAIEAMLLRTWRTMWNASPNVALTDPTIQVVELRDDDSVGARALMDRLLFVATSIGR